jgi:hypothetical protein
MSNTTDRPDAATLELWRAAETGEFGELTAMLPRVTDVNARNEHGVTALMRAAQQGHARVVRLLLSHGADANVVRNDKFTALSLAAFFGHTEVVGILMEHGADSKASTRHGTSAHMWATARTFNQVVDQLKKPAPEKVDERTVIEPKPPLSQPPLPVAPVAPRPVTAAIVRTLKDPPEIWDLVHEAPRGFDARSAFMGHLQSMRRGLLFRVATVGVLICACVVGVLVLRGAQARSESRPQLPAKPVQSSAAAPAPAAPSFVAPPVPPVTTENDNFRTEITKPRRSHSSVARFRAGEGESAEAPAASGSPQRIQIQTEKTNSQAKTSNAQTETSDVKARSDSANRTKPSSPLSPQLITPAKNASPKSKVIQWP